MKGRVVYDALAVWRPLFIVGRSFYRDDHVARVTFFVSVR